MTGEATSRLLRRGLRRAIEGRGTGLPSGAEPLLRIFLALSEQRRSDGGSPLPIGFVEIEAYARLMGWPLEPHHVETIRALDREWLKAVRERGDRKGRVAGTMNAAAFDAVFG